MTSRIILTAGFLVLFAGGCGGEAENTAKNTGESVLDDERGAEKPEAAVPNTIAVNSDEKGNDLQGSDLEKTDEAYDSTPIPPNEDCDVPSICQLCDDGETCATPEVDSECRDINWVCPDE